jgi:tetratricopeptide (TPR) repeat protein
MTWKTRVLVVALSAHVAVASAQTKPQAAPPRKAPAPAPIEGSREELLARAAAELSQGHREEAARLFQSVAQRFGSVQALMQLARIQSGNGDATGALASLSQARALAPNSEEVLVAFAQVALAAKNPMPAVHTLQSLTRMCPTAPEYHYQLGVALMLSGDMPAAVEALERAEQLDPNDGLTLVALGLALNDRKLYAEARPPLQRSLELMPDNIDALAALAEAEEGLGALDAAQTHAQRALDRDAAHPGANLVMGLLLMRRERYADARDALLRTVNGNPSNPKAYYQLSLAYSRLGDEATAKKYVDLYQQKLRDVQERVRLLRGESRPGG